MIKGGQHLEVVYEPGTPFGSDASGDEVQGADIGDAVRDEDIQGKKIPEFQQLGPALHEAESADKVVVGEEELTGSSSVEKLRRARFLRCQHPVPNRRSSPRSRRTTLLH